MPENTKQRILQYLDNKQISKREFYLKTGLSNGFLDKVDNIGSDKLEKIISAYGDLNLSWLVSGSGDMIVSESGAFLSQKRKGYKSEFNTVPIIDVKAAANYKSGYVTDGYIDTLDRMIIPSSLIGHKKHYVFRNWGDSMHPTLYDGDYVVASYVDKSEWQHITDNLVYIIIIDGQGIYIKRLKKSSKEKKISFRCRSDNRTHPSFNAEIEKIIEIWKVSCKISFNLPNENENIYNKIDFLEERIEKLEHQKK
jgi:SOS-response transcriptional repressor LexA